jgi:hypothetical protein
MSTSSTARSSRPAEAARRGATRSPDGHAVGRHQQVALHVEVVEQLDRLEAADEATARPLVGSEAIERHIAEGH